MTWKRAAYYIETIARDGDPLRVEVKGAVLDGVLGVHRGGLRRTLYVVTHLPTGAAVSPWGGFARQQTAKAFAERILPLADWPHVTRESAKGIDWEVIRGVADALLTEEAAA